jgi:cell division transport system permease protein
MSPLDRAWRGSRNDWRLHLLSVFSVAVAFVCLGAAVLVVVNVDAVRTRWANAGRASVYLKAGAAADQATSIEKALRETEGVSEVRFVSSEAARREVVGNGSDEVLDALPTEAFPASLELRMADGTPPERLARIATRLGAHPAVEIVETYQDWSDRLTNLLAGGVTASLILALVVLAAVISVVSSTIRLALQRRRIEVEVLKLVGATDGYVRRPFLVEGAAQGAVGAALAVVLLAILYAVVRSHFDGQLGTLLGVSPAFLPWSVSLAMVGLGAALGAVAAFFSLRKLLVV